MTTSSVPSSAASSGASRSSGGSGPAEFAQSFLKRDTDDNRVIELAELPTSLQFLFPGVDRDRNGEIDHLELAQFEMCVDAEPDGRQLRNALVSEDPPSPQTVRRLREVLDSMKRTEAANEAQVASVRRSEWFWYAFTVGAMLIGVISFGHLLSTPPPNG